MGELERQLSQRMTIVIDTFCGQCGYNLRTQRVFGRCPECGGEYDARATVQKGILRDEDIQFPWFGVLGAVISGAFGAGGIVGALKTGHVWPWVPAGFFTLLCLLFAFVTFREASRFIRHRLLLRSALRDADA